MLINNDKYILLLANKCISEKELSKLSGVSTVTLSRIKKGEQTPRPQTIGKIAKVLNVKVEFLIK